MPNRIRVPQAEMPVVLGQAALTAVSLDHDATHATDIKSWRLEQAVLNTR